MEYIFMEKMEKPLSKLTFYAIYVMDFCHRITYVKPELDILLSEQVYLHIPSYSKHIPGIASSRVQFLTPPFSQLPLLLKASGCWVQSQTHFNLLIVI